MVGPWAVLMETRERPPPMSETSMLGSLRGADGDPGAPTTYIEDVDGGPLGDTDGDPKPLTTYVGDVDGGPLGGTDGDPGAPTTYVRDVDGGPPGRR
jgi:hypothetical protein